MLNQRRSRPISDLISTFRWKNHPRNDALAYLFCFLYFYFTIVRWSIKSLFHNWFINSRFVCPVVAWNQTFKITKWQNFHLILSSNSQPPYYIFHINHNILSIWNLDWFHDTNDLRTWKSRKLAFLVFRMVAFWKSCFMSQYF